METSTVLIFSNSEKGNHFAFTLQDRLLKIVFEQHECVSISVNIKGIRLFVHNFT